MNRVEAALRRIASDLEEMRVRWALVGGFAVSVRTEPRFTRDVDVAVVVDDDQAAERFVESLTRIGYRLDAIVEQDAAGPLATARMIAPGIENLGVVVEVLEVLPDLWMPVATAGHLVALKLLARDDEARPQDAADLRALRSVLDPVDHRTVRDAVGLIVERGFGRGRPLVALAEEYLAG